MLTRTRITTTGTLPEPWRQLTYNDIIHRQGGQLVNDGRSSRVYRFPDENGNFYLKRYLYRKIHWRHCWEKSQVEREFENLERVRQANLGCRVIEILAYGDRRRCTVLLDAFLLSREVPGSHRLSLFLATLPDHPERPAIVAKIITFAERVMEKQLALTDLFFRNLVVVPETAELYLLDIQQCRRNRKKALRKSWPQLWADIELFFTPAERALAAERLGPILGKAFPELRQRARTFIPKEKRRKEFELEYPP
ncbi:MAG: hypothetical protein GXO34_02695, partial [Deltaproteobacteria bacterium]|nr:hypothetical protein [Deltaproteobacteria bacterium]